jgi:hypothetical protein
MKDNKLKVKLFLDKRPEGIVQPDGTFGTQNINDYYVNINLCREMSIIDEYIDIQLDPFRTSIERQLVNPWFNEFGFFESIISTGISGKTRDMQIVPELQNVQKKAGIFSIDINR